MMRRIILFALVLLLLVSLAAAPPTFFPLGAMSLPESGCANQRFGLVGASNTWDTNPDGSSIPLPWRNVKIIQDMCPGSTVFLNAVGGFSPEAQVPLLALVLTNDNLDYVIIDPSANGQFEFSGWTAERYKAAVINLARMVKDKNSNIKVIILTNTPLKGALGKNNAGETIVIGTDEAVQRVKAFNADLLNTKLGTDSIDYAVNTYAATEDPAGSDSCGKYCDGFDKLHFGEAGRKQVMKAVMDTVFGTPTIATTVTGTTASLGTENCLSKQRCKEIDEVWQKITQWLATARKGQIWDTVRGDWGSYAEKYLKTVQLGPTKPTPTVTPVPSKTGLCVATFGTTEQRALLDTIAWAEGTAGKGDRGYNIMYGLKEFRSYSTHPVETGEMTKEIIGGGKIPSTAAGRYQFLYTRYKQLKEQGNFKTGFNPKEQDKAALSSVAGYGVTNEILTTAVNTGEFTSVWDKLAREWASLPYSKQCPPDIIEKYSQYSWFDPSKCGNGRSIYSQGGVSYDGLKNRYLTCLEHHSVDGVLGALTNCPSEMANIDGRYCIDKWENSISDKKNPSEKASLYYPAKTSQANSLYNYWKDGWKGTPVPNSAYAQMPERGAEVTTGFTPLAVSQQNVIPNMYVSKEIAGQACANAGKRLCTEEEWVRACKGPSSTQYPYGNDYAAGKCNTNHAEKYPPGVVGWQQAIPKEQFDPSDPRNGKAAVDVQGVRETGSFSECTNAYGVYDLVGNLAEAVSTPSSIGMALFKGSAFMRGGNNLDCNNNIGAHAATYTDYSFGFRCCATLS